MAKKIVIEETKKVTTKKPAVVNRVTSRKALGSSPIKSDNEITDDFFAQQVEEAKSKINWFESKRGYGNNNIVWDISITKGSTKSKPKYNFVFRNDYTFIFGKMVQVGNYENKLFLKEVKSFGYAITVQERGAGKSKSRSGYMKMPVCKETEWLDKFLGNHTIKYDDLLELYYVEINEKK